MMLLVITAILLRNRYSFRGIDAEPKAAGKTVEVSICVPARNEEAVIERCLVSTLEQSYEKVNVLVLDDGSTDRTPRILSELKRRYPDTLVVLSGSERPEGWLGKPYACHQLGKAAEGDLIIFADADTWFDKDMVTKAVHAFESRKLDFLTIWPDQIMLTFWEKMIVPLVYYALLGFLPVTYTERPPNWMPKSFRSKYKTMFAAACGQFMAFKRDFYHEIGGHDAVKDQIVEDVELARQVMKYDGRMMMMHGLNQVFCRMYTSADEIYQGFRKNFLAGFGYNIPLFILMGILHFGAYILPVPLLIAGIILPNAFLIYLSVFALGMAFLHRLLLAEWLEWDKWIVVLHPLSVFWFQRLALTTLIDRIRGRKISWKGRSV